MLDACPIQSVQFPSRLTQTQPARHLPHQAFLSSCACNRPLQWPCRDRNEDPTQLHLVHSDISKYLGSKCLAIQRSHTPISCMPKKNDTKEQLPTLPARPSNTSRPLAPLYPSFQAMQLGTTYFLSVGHANTYQKEACIFIQDSGKLSKCET